MWRPRRRSTLFEVKCSNETRFWFYNENRMRLGIWEMVRGVPHSFRYFYESMPAEERHRKIVCEREKGKKERIWTKVNMTWVIRYLANSWCFAIVIMVVDFRSTSFFSLSIIIFFCSFSSFRLTSSMCVCQIYNANQNGGKPISDRSFRAKN